VESVLKKKESLNTECKQDTARICCGAVAAERRRLLSPAGGALSSKPACTLLLSIDGTDRRTDA